MKLATKLIVPFMFSFLLSNSVVNAQDWANLKKYQSENLKLPEVDKSTDRVVFMGNSITQQWKELRQDFFSTNPYVCRGISGQTTPQMLLRFRQDVVELKPKVVVILAGTNDIAGNTGPSTLEMIVDNIASMAEIAKANKIKVVICSVLPAFDYPWKKGQQPNEKIPALNSLLKDYCNKNKVLFLDYFSSMTDGKNGLRAELTTDGVHCTTKGYELMENLVVPAIKKVSK